MVPVPVMIAVIIPIVIAIVVPIAVVMDSMIVIAIVVVFIVMATHRSDAQHAQNDRWEDQFEIAHRSPSVEIRGP
jgi:hypothetical protein